jgi:hypothetical protein
VSLIGDRDEGENPGRQYLLAVHDVRRSMERVTGGNRSTSCASMAMTPGTAIRERLELITAFDRGGKTCATPADFLKRARSR